MQPGQSFSDKHLDHRLGETRDRNADGWIKPIRKCHLESQCSSVFRIMIHVLPLKSHAFLFEFRIIYFRLKAVLTKQVTTLVLNRLSIILQTSCGRQSISSLKEASLRAGFNALIFTAEMLVLIVKRRWTLRGVFSRILSSEIAVLFLSWHNVTKLICFYT